MKDIKIDKKLLKVIVPVAIVLIVALVGFTGCKAMKPTPEKIVKKYCDYLADKKYDKAYKLLYNADNDFTSEEIFKMSLENVDFKNYTTKPVSKNNLENWVYGIETNDTTYEIEASGNKYVLEVSEVGTSSSKEYKINAANLSLENWVINAPHGAEVYMNGKKLDNTDGKSSYLGNKWGGVNYYKMQRIFKGNYDFTFKIDGAEDVNIDKVEAGKSIPSQELKIKQDVTDELESQSKAFLKAYYAKGDLDNLVSSKSKIVDEIKEYGLYTELRAYPEGPETMNDNLKFEKPTIYDSANASIQIRYSTNVASKEGKAEYKVNKTAYFTKEGGKWLLNKLDY